MLPGLVLMPIFVGAGIFWIFGPGWSWIPFIAIYAIIMMVTLVAGPTRIVHEAPSAAQSTSSTFSLTMLLAIAIAVGIVFNRQLWELILSTGVLISSAALWPRLRTR